VQPAQATLEMYDVEFVYVGPLERQQYEPAALEKFGQFMDVAFQSGEVTIYQRRSGAAAFAEIPGGG